MRVIKCDRCGAIIPKSQDSVGYISVNLRDVETDDLLENNPFEHWDLCDGCMKAIHAFITKPGAKTEKFEQILDSGDAGKKPEKKKQAPKFDAGKAQALRDANRPVAWIAKEMGVSEQSIRNHTTPPAPRKEKPLEWAEHEPDLDPVINATAETAPFKAPKEAEG